MNWQPDRTELREIFVMRNGDPELTGWSPRLRWTKGYFTPDEYYEALVRRLVDSSTRWLDVGCGRSLFPGNPGLARELSDRCRVLVGVDPDPTIHENEYLHERIQGSIEDVPLPAEFDLITLRMVAEHLGNPDREVAVLSRLATPTGRLVVFTPFKWSPLAILARWIPHALHHPIKRLVWRTEAKDTFPVRFRMNTRREMRQVLERNGFREQYIDLLDDCRTFGNFRGLHHLELYSWQLFHGLGFPFPERCILAAYERRREAISHGA